jgi:CcmD family protein
MNLRILALMLLLAAPAYASQQAPAKPPTAAQDGFVPVDAPLSAKDTIPAPRLVAIAYGFIWVIVFGYVVSVRVRLSKVEREMETVTRRIAAGGRSA